MKLLRYGRVSSSAQVGSGHLASNALSSARSLSCTSCFLASSYRHHDMVMADVSCPPARRTRSCETHKRSESAMVFSINSPVVPDGIQSSGYNWDGWGIWLQRDGVAYVSDDVFVRHPLDGTAFHTGLQHERQGITRVFCPKSAKHEPRGGSSLAHRPASFTHSSHMCQPPWPSSSHRGAGGQSCV